MPITQLFAPPVLKQKTYTIGGATFRMIELFGTDHFMMGNERGEEESFDMEHPKHTRVINPFSLAEFLVTQQLWQEVVAQARMQGLLEEQALPLNPTCFQGPNRPVESVNWYEARKFCKVLNLLTIGHVNHFRLPSEAEWEYAARVGNRDKVYAGSNQVIEIAWFNLNNKQETMPVGLLPPNDFGLYDLSGNVREWCEDDWHSNYEDCPSDSEPWLNYPGLPIRTVPRVLRGGSWNEFTWDCRCAFRSKLMADDRLQNGGFRLAAPIQE